MNLPQIKACFLAGKNGLIYSILSDHFEIIDDEHNPDWIIDVTSPQVSPFSCCKYDGVRVAITYVENANANFSIYDYVVGFEEIKYRDRYCNYYLFLHYFHDLSKDELKNEKIVNMRGKGCAKEYFCDFIYSHQTTEGVRERLLQKLSNYKRVECYGSYLNNCDGARAHNYDEKKAFQRKCKFSIACELTSVVGFTTEKILHPFLAGSIPIYYGNPDIAKIFNNKAFVNCHDFDSIDAVVEYVKYLDENDDAYNEMLAQPIFVDSSFPYKTITNLENWLINVFSQNRNDAYRRPREYMGAKTQIYSKYADRLMNSFFIKLLNMTKGIIKKILSKLSSLFTRK